MSHREAEIRVAASFDLPSHTRRLDSAIQANVAYALGQWSVERVECTPFNPLPGSLGRHGDT